MEILLYANSSEKERIDKTSYLSLLGTYEGFLRSPSSVINPTIQLDLGSLKENKVVDEDNEEIADADNVQIVSGAERITDANYMYIPPLCDIRGRSV